MSPALTISPHITTRPPVAVGAKAPPEVEKLNTLAQQTEEVLLHVRSFFPLDFFPDDIIVDKNKITVIHRLFFWTGQRRSIPIEEVGDVVVETGPFFASMSILHKRALVESVTVKYLWRRDAIRAQEIIMGLVLAANQEVNFAQVQKEELLKKAQVSGKVLSGTV